ncbi:glycosyltransferase family 1 protein [Bacillus sp. FJAT-42376]|uniref:glycosyltransferase family 4 protein n=1 Tax=Bacillus sp. FJAT-42376 TaxID=2014076 RepID=UPI000F500DD5|nr:glycosyltransferase family 4 protein [Bacillus sp. FJAT-42376]AZB43593.1 glycosyltransferase family 1 protein [Bacillus sp. FJAT-42376]
MAKKVLLTATVDYHFKAFHLPVMKWFKEQNWEVHIAASGDLDLPYADVKYNIPIQRSPIKSQNMYAFKELKNIICENEYDIIHCHTPMGGVLTRLAAMKARKKGTKLIYTAHGFHFCKGSSASSWFVFYPIERLLAAFTDCLITINHEDYNLAEAHSFPSRIIERVNGVGVNTERFNRINSSVRDKSRRLFGFDENQFLLFNAAEFNKNKNQELLIRALALIKEKVPNVRLLLAGEGVLLDRCTQLARELKTDHLIQFLGFRKDIAELLPLCDAAVGPSFREGLPVNIMEAMACGLPVIAADNRGHRELIISGQNGWLVRQGDIEDMAARILQCSRYPKQQLQKMGIAGREKIEKKYSEQIVLEQKKSIYSAYMNEKGRPEWAVL